MRETYFDGTPFNKLISWQTFPGPGGIAGDVRAQLVFGDKSKIIRRVPLYKLENKSDPNSEVLDKLGIFKEFGSHPNLRVPRLDVIRGGLALDDTHQPFLIVVDFIKGANLHKIRFNSRQRDAAGMDMEDFLLSLISYTNDKYLKGGWFPADQMYAQYVYGRVLNEKGNNNTYFVDLDFIFGFMNAENRNAPANSQFMIHLVQFAGGFINVLEDKLPGITFVSAREKYKELLEQIQDTALRYVAFAEGCNEAVNGKKDWREVTI